MLIAELHSTPKEKTHGSSPLTFEATKQIVVLQRAGKQTQELITYSLVFDEQDAP